MEADEVLHEAPGRRRRAAKLLALVGSGVFLLRLAAGVVQIHRGRFLQHDGHDYNDLARNLAAGRGYLVERVRWFECPRELPAPDFSRPPLAPILVAAFYAILPDSLYVAAAVQAAVGTAACFLAAALARKLAGRTTASDKDAQDTQDAERTPASLVRPPAASSPQTVEPEVSCPSCPSLLNVVNVADPTGLAALGLAGVWPVFLYHAGHFSTEALMSLLVAALMLALLPLSRESGSVSRKSLARAAAAGVLLGLSALCRPTMLVGFVLVPAWVFFFPGRARARRSTSSRRARPEPVEGRARSCALAGVVLAAAVLTVAPWTLRNYVASGELIPVTNFGGYAFWYGNNEHNFRAYSSLRYREFDEHQRRFLREETPRLISGLCRTGRTSPGEQERFWRREGMRFVKRNPGKFLFLVAARTVHFFRPWVSPSAYGAAGMVVSLVLWGPLYVAALVGFVRLRRKETAGAAAVLTVVLSGAVAHALTFLSIRHRCPFVDTAAVCLAAPVVLDWGRALLRRYGRRG